MSPTLVLVGQGVAEVQKYIGQDTAKCTGVVGRTECNDCARRLLPAHPDAIWQSWMTPWDLESPCPSKFVEKDADYGLQSIARKRQR